MPDIDAKLAQSLKQARSAPMFFAFVAKGASEGSLIVSKQKIPATEIKAAKEKCGGTGLFTGRCFGENGLTVFEVNSEPPGTLAPQLKKIINRDAGLSLQVETRVAGPGEAQKEQQVPGAAPPAPGGDGAATFKARLQTVVPLSRQASERAPARKGELEKLAAQAVAAGRSQDFATALNHLNNLEHLAQQIVAVPAPPPAPPPDEMPAFKERFRKVSALYMEAVKKAPDRKAVLEALAARALAAAKVRNFPEASGHLDKLEALSRHFLRAAPTPTSQPPSAPPKANTDPGAVCQERLKALRPDFDKALAKARALNPDWAKELDQTFAQVLDELKAKNLKEALSTLLNLTKLVRKVLDAPAGDPATFKQRLKEVLPLQQQAIQKAPDSKTELEKLSAQAGAAARDKQFDYAVDLLDQLEVRCKTALRSAEVKSEIETAAGKGNVSFRKHLLKWKAAKKKAAAELDKLKAAVVADTEAAAALPDWDGILKGAENLHKLIAVFHVQDAKLADALDDLDNAATPEARQTAKKQAAGLVAQYQQVLEDPIYALIDNGAYGTIRVAAPLAAPLKELAAALA